MLQFTYIKLNVLSAVYYSPSIVHTKVVSSCSKMSRVDLFLYELSNRKLLNMPIVNGFYSYTAATIKGLSNYCT